MSAEQDTELDNPEALALGRPGGSAPQDCQENRTLAASPSSRSREDHVRPELMYSSGLTNNHTAQGVNRNAASKESKGTSSAQNKLGSQVWEYERKIVDRRKDEIDNMLVFAALFSAVLTAFIIDSYQDLKPKLQNESTLILRQISAQIASSTISAGYLNSTKPAFSDLPASASVEHPSLATVVVNALWFSALVFSLMSASVGIAIRQWLNHHGDEPVGVEPLVSVHIWHVRHKGYLDWHVTGLLDLLPVLLQISVVLFLAGLVIQLRNLHPVIADIITAQAAILWMILLVTTLAPSFWRRCPYKSPQALWTMQAIYLLGISTSSSWTLLQRIDALDNLFSSAHRWVGEGLKQVTQAVMPLIKSISRKATILLSGWPRNWKVYEKDKLSAKQELLPVIKADLVLMDDEFLEGFVRPHMNDHDDNEASFRSLCDIITQRADRPNEVWWCRWFKRTEHNSQSLITLGHIILDLLLRCEPEQDPNAHKTSIFEGNEQLQRYIAPCIDHLIGLLEAIPGTQPDVYQRLIEAITDNGTSQEVRAGMAQALYWHRNRFIVNTIDVQKLIDCIPTVEAEPEKLCDICESILGLSSRLPKFDADRIYAGYGAAISSTLERIAVETEWSLFWRLLDIFADFSNGRVAAQILTNAEGMLGRWKELSASCNDSNRRLIALHLERLRALAWIPAPLANPETEIDVLMEEKRERVATELPAWVAERDRCRVTEQ